MDTMEPDAFQNALKYKEEKEIFIKSNDQTDNVNLKSSDLQTKQFTSTSIVTLQQIDIVDSSKDNDGVDDNIVILRKDPKTQRNQINKTAYAKLHRTLSASRNSNSVDTLKEKYEGNAKPDLINVNTENNNENEETPDNSTKQFDEETVGALKTKYSPASFGYPKPMNKNSKLPTPKPRNAVKSQIIVSSNKQNESNKVRYSLDEKKSKPKDENSNELFRRNSSSSGEFISIVTRSESEGSIDKFEKELNLFTMESKPKEKKRSSSFRKIFSGRIFSKDKKKKEDEKNKLQYKENMARSENLENETNVFHRQSQHRHTTGGSSGINTKNNLTRTQSDRSAPQQVHITKEMEERYAQMHVNQFNCIVQNFENPEQTTKKPLSEGYVPMDKPIVKNNSGPINYMNIPNIKKYIDTSSSASTLESEKSNLYQNDSVAKGTQLSPDDKVVVFIENNKDIINKNTPPRAQELRQDVRLVNPKALIPINTERPLPNPYQNNNEQSVLDKPKISPKPHITRTTKANVINQPRFEETYGTVFDNLRKNHAMQRPPTHEMDDLKSFQKPPRSPSFEPTKLKLPPNREIVPLSPRVKSPIPHDNISTEKIIATELLKPNKSPVAIKKGGTRLSSPSHQKLEIDIDYPDYVNNVARNDKDENRMPLSAKPPISKSYLRKDASNYNETLSPNQLTFENSRMAQTFPVEHNIYAIRKNLPSSPADRDLVYPNVNVQTSYPRARTPTPNNVLVNRSLSPLRPQSVRSSTPVDPRTSPSISTSPQKDDMRKSVEAYYWKEIKKLKEQENFDLYLYQMEMMPYGYAEDPISIRRSRSLSPTSHKSSRRSLSLPRDIRQPAREIPSNYYRVQTDSIPEGRAVINTQIPQRNIIYGQLQYQPKVRAGSTSERKPSDNSDSLSRPIFKRGSLSTPIKDAFEDPQNKKVSFSNSRSNPDTQSLQAWPTKNGFTQSPPQRRINNNRNSALDDDVFLPNTVTKTYGGNVYEYTIKQPQNLRYDFQTKPNETDFSSRYNVPRQNLQQMYDPYQTSRQCSSQPQGYRQLQGESLYGQPVDAIKQPYVLTRHGSIQLQEPLYGQRQNVARRMSYDNSQIDRRQIESPYINQQYVSYNQVADPVYGLQRREIIMKDEIFGQFGGYLPQNTNEQLYDIQQRQRQPQIQNPVYSSRQSVAEPLYGRSGQKQVSIRNKVCDMYGQIHDRDSPAPGQIKNGVILGQLQQRNPGSPQVVRQSHSHLSGEQFARNTRLTASANDMYRRYQNTDPRLQPSDAIYRGVGPTPNQEMGAPNRPLPPVPVDRRKTQQNSSGKSDTESASDASEMQKFRNNTKNKKRSLFGK